MRRPRGAGAAVVVATAALLLSGCVSDEATVQPQAGGSSAPAPTSSPAPTCDPDAAFLIGAIRTYAADKATLVKHLSGLDPGPFRVFAAKVQRLLTGVATHPVPNALFTTRDQELQAFTRIVQGAGRVASADVPADAAAGKQAIDAGEAQLNQVGASLSDAVAACR
jgi:hypothetical protein